ncbi:MAG TPA: alpha/beta hydrolase [Caulobacteraceae bacterium]|jgi:pimeloyl-ACP methyl ester carboxylesterase|nr:alpha/beta hydrolase [Caulobacteraceae bacterium]
MDVRIFETRFGPTPIWGDFARFSPERRLLFVIRGAFSKKNVLLGLTQDFPGVDVAYAHLPGMFSEPFLRDSIEDFAAAFDEVLAQLAHRQSAVIGLSLGGTAAIAMQDPSIRAKVLVDSPITTGRLWMLPDIFRAKVQSNPRLAQWVWNLFGVSEHGIVGRDYRGLLSRLNVPTLALVAGDPLGEPRPIVRAPSAVSDEDRALYAAHPMITVRIVASCGHNIAKDGQADLARAIRRVVEVPQLP